MKLTKTSCKAFTLIEMLIVIGILAILTGVMVRMFGTSTESARAAQCMTNMRNLAVAVQNYCMADSEGHYPAAGSFDYLDTSTGGPRYHERKGWISWKSEYINNPSSATRLRGTSITFDQGSRGQDNSDNKYAITNGAIWSIVRDFKSYVCPDHLKACQNADSHKTYLWSYVMNRRFGYYREASSSWQGMAMGGFDSPDRVLLFAELPALDYKQQTKVTEGSGEIGDPTLNYSNETIGFNHKVGSRYVGHVAFADGHVAKLFYPEGGGLSLRDITQKLCEGKELIFEGGQYKEAE
jgi:prepilin-type N-terminal cleavage/methylation domain-containing protein/prepilin-type processing-associated H-X9-DG protein